MPARVGGERRIIIIGSGFSGLCAGIALKRAGIHAFTILERADRLGGTWRENTYPGAACDVPSISYCFSFEQKTDWSRKWSPHGEILAYMKHCATKYGLDEHIRYNTGVSSARFDEPAGVWQLRTEDGETLTADILISAVGQLNRPYTPKIPGLDSFAGVQFHSAQWNHACDLAGKRVGVIGNAASAIQFIPEIAKDAGRVTIFQRSANWMVPKLDRDYTELEKRILTRVPLAAKLYRWLNWSRYERLFPVFRRNRYFGRKLEKGSIEVLRAEVEDKELQEKLIPSYPIGGKRILFSDDYYLSLNRSNVEIVTESIGSVNEHGVMTQDGVQHDFDVLVIATGFESTDFLQPMKLEGLAGRTLNEEWKKGARAYRGMTVTGFPNFFMMYGPNTNLGHNSIIFMIECQTTYILDCIQHILGRGLDYIDLRRDAMEAYNTKLQEELAGTVWAVTGKSWYKNEAGKITNNWPGSTIRYWWTTRHADLRAYHQQSANPAAGAMQEALVEAVETRAAEVG